MVLDSKIEAVKDAYHIETLEDWAKLAPTQVTILDGIGPATLNLIRLYLANKGLTLRNDATPEYWKKHLSDVRVGHTMGDRDVCDVCPFTVLVDSMEQQPFTFELIKGDADTNNRPIIVPLEFKHLGIRNGRYYEPRGDYSIAGFEGLVHVERKSGVDAQSTLLGWGERRERFERELEVLANLPYAAVVIECSLGAMIQHAPDRGRKSVQENAKILHRQVLAYQQDFRVPWIFADNRRLAEITTFRILERFWRKNHEAESANRKQQGSTNEHDANDA